MSEISSAKNAWRRTPAEYAASRPAEFRVPTAPLSQYVTMRDGCRLAVDVYLPQSDATARKVPAIVLFTPYFRRCTVKKPDADRIGRLALFRDIFVPRGYALVIVDVRGTGASFGRRTAFRSPVERVDYREIADWIVRQSWSNGAIGSTGISYLGAAACFLASTGHPAVKAIAPMAAVSDIYNEQLYPGGLMARQWSRDYDDLMVALDRDDASLKSRLRFFAMRPDIDGAHPVDDTDGEALLKLAQQEHRDNVRLHDLLPEWQWRDEGPASDPTLTTDVCSPFFYLKKGIPKNLPVYSISGWFDGGGYANGSISRFLTLAGKHDRLMLGGWEHTGGINISPWREVTASRFPIWDEVLRFFDQHLMGLDTGIELESRVHYYSVHSEAWRESDSWPIATSTQQWHLLPSGELGTNLQDQESTASYQVSFTTGTGPQSRWETPVGSAGNDFYTDWRAREEQMLTFTSSPLVSDLEIAGHIKATLKLSSSEKDAALFLYVSEVEPDGKSHHITEGVIRALHRKTAKSPSVYRTTWTYRSFKRKDAALLQPGEMSLVEVSLLPVAWTIKKGNRLRVCIAGADVDHFPCLPHGRPPRLEFALGGPSGCTVELPVCTTRVSGALKASDTSTH